VPKSVRGSIGLNDKSELLDTCVNRATWFGLGCGLTTGASQPGHDNWGLNQGAVKMSDAMIETVLSLERLAAWRRDVRRFRSDPVAPALIERLLRLADLAPSVGNSQPWRVVHVADPQRRAAIRQSFAAANERAANLYVAGDGGPREHYLALKLAGFDNAPVHLAVFSEHGQQGRGLGVQTMPEAYDYSCACMIMLLWLAAREAGVGVGWVSIIEPAVVARCLDVPPEWTFVGYLLLGWPEEEHLDPELERFEWQSRTPFAGRQLQR
jgi:uroporphyrin-III C-methyltransferase / precorrin-2 dehydrogenase / sirohydrochlorin ferrochelatase